MRTMILCVAVVLFAGPVFAQEAPAAWNVVRQCQVAPGEGGDLRAALQAFVDYIADNPPPANMPGSVHGNFRQRVWGEANWATVYEVENIAAYDDFVRARREWFQQDQRAGELYGAMFSHVVPQSCQTSFHQRWP